MGIRTRRIEIQLPEGVNVAQADFTKFEKNPMLLWDHNFNDPIAMMSDIRYVPYKQSFTGRPEFPVMRTDKSDAALFMHRKYMLTCGVGGKWDGKTFVVHEISLMAKPSNRGLPASKK